MPKLAKFMQKILPSQYINAMLIFWQKDGTNPSTLSKVTKITGNTLLDHVL
jgi:hypothetical protein